MTEQQMTVQRLEALEAGNQVRIKRAADKKKIARGDLDPAVILRTLPSHWAKAKIIDLLLPMRKVGRMKAERWCRYAQVSPTKPLIEMTERQRLSLARHVDIYTGRRDAVRNMLEEAA